MEGEEEEDKKGQKERNGAATPGGLPSGGTSEVKEGEASVGMTYHGGGVLFSFFFCVSFFFSLLFPPFFFSSVGHAREMQECQQRQGHLGRWAGAEPHQSCSSGVAAAVTSGKGQKRTGSNQKTT